VDIVSLTVAQLDNINKQANKVKRIFLIFIIKLLLLIQQKCQTC
jgi:hypothetical protein